MFVVNTLIIRLVRGSKPRSPAGPNIHRVELHATRGCGVFVPTVPGDLIAKGNLAPVTRVGTMVLH